MKGAKFDELCIHCCDFSRFIIRIHTRTFTFFNSWSCMKMYTTIKFHDVYILWYVFKKIINGGQHFEHEKTWISCITFSKKLNEEKPHKFQKVTSN
jgi:hypothetical protein